MPTLSVLKEITDKELRTIWPHEAHDFTPWLAKDENMTLLADAIGLDIDVDEIESNVGEFSLDILASESGTSRRIVIENQLEDTNHDHLGKLITYASGKDAAVIIWIVKHAREEHRAAIEWLNNHTDNDIGLFLCEIKLYQIGNSDPAVKFEVVEKPNDWAKEVRKSESSATTARQLVRKEYWTAFRDYAKANPAFASKFKLRRPGTDAWYDFSIGSSLCHLSIWQIRKRNEMNAELYIPDNMELFAKLLRNKEEIETESGLAFDWRELPEKKASRILLIESADFGDKGAWHQQFDWFMDRLERMKATFSKYL